MREFNALLQAAWAGGRGDPFPLSLLPHTRTHISSVELVLEEMQAERSSDKARLGFRGVCTYSSDWPQLPLGNTGR